MSRAPVLDQSHTQRVHVIEGNAGQLPVDNKTSDGEKETPMMNSDAHFLQQLVVWKDSLYMGDFLICLTSDVL